MTGWIYFLIKLFLDSLKAEPFLSRDKKNHFDFRFYFSMAALKYLICFRSKFLSFFIRFYSFPSKFYKNALSKINCKANGKDF